MHVLSVQMVTDAVLKLEDNLDLELIGVKKEPGGSLEDSEFVEGVAFKKTFSYAGFEQQPKQLEQPKILLLNVELELKAEKEVRTVGFKRSLGDAIECRDQGDQCSRLPVVCGCGVEYHL